MPAECIYIHADFRLTSAMTRSSSPALLLSRFRKIAPSRLTPSARRLMLHVDRIGKEGGGALCWFPQIAILPRLSSELVTQASSSARHSPDNRLEPGEIRSPMPIDNDRKTAITWSELAQRRLRESAVWKNRDFDPARSSRSSGRGCAIIRDDDPSSLIHSAEKRNHRCARVSSAAPRSCSRCTRGKNSSCEAKRGE